MEYSNLTIEYSKLNELNLNSNIPFHQKFLIYFIKIIILGSISFILKMKINYS